MAKGCRAALHPSNAVALWPDEILRLNRYWASARWRRAFALFERAVTPVQVRLTLANTTLTQRALDSSQAARSPLVTSTVWALPVSMQCAKQASPSLYTSALGARRCSHQLIGETLSQAGAGSNTA